MGLYTATARRLTRQARNGAMWTIDTTDVLTCPVRSDSTRTGPTLPALHHPGISADTTMDLIMGSITTTMGSITATMDLTMDSITTTMDSITTTMDLTMDS